MRGIFCDFGDSLGFWEWECRLFLDSILNDVDLFITLRIELIGVWAIKIR
jgi:hypothetical protein